MARVGGRNTPFAWIVGLVCAGIVAGLAFLALPMLPATVDWMGDRLRDPSNAPVATGDDLSPAEATECRDLYVDALWSSLVWAPESLLDQSTASPTTTATDVVEALAPSVRMTCDWRSSTGTISTTVAVVAADAGAIVTAALPSLGFTCAQNGERIRCVREDGDLTESIETGRGLWLSSSQNAWYPADYSRRVADRVWIAGAGTEAEADAEAEAEAD